MSSTPRHHVSASSSFSRVASTGNHESGRIRGCGTPPRRDERGSPAPDEYDSRSSNSFSRSDEQVREGVDVTRILERRSSSRTTRFDTVPTDARFRRSCPRCAANEGQLGQVFLNLLLTLRNRSPKGGDGQRDQRSHPTTRRRRRHRDTRYLRRLLEIAPYFQTLTDQPTAS